METLFFQIDQLIQLTFYSLCPQIPVSYGLCSLQHKVEGVSERMGAAAGSLETVGGNGSSAGCGSYSFTSSPEEAEQELCEFKGSQYCTPNFRATRTT